MTEQQIIMRSHPPAVMTIADACLVCSVNRDTLASWRKDGLRCIDRGGKKLILRRDLMAFLSKQAGGRDGQPVAR